MIVQDWNIHQVGIFVCKNCQNELFSTDRQDKYKTVFMQPFSEHSIEKKLKLPQTPTIMLLKWEKLYVKISKCYWVNLNLANGGLQEW